MITWIFALFSGMSSSMQSAFTKLGSASCGKNGAMSFNAFKVGFAVLFFALLSLGNISFNVPTLVYALIYGTALLVSTFTGYLALMKGPMALTSLIVSYSLVIPCIFGFVWFKESPALLKISGLVLLMLSMFMLKKKDITTQYQKGWLTCVIITFTCNGIASVIQKLHQTVFPGEFLWEFTLYSFGLMLIFFIVCTLIQKQKITAKGAAFSIPAGITMGIMNYLTLALSSKLDATALFPMVTVFTAVFNFTVSGVFFKDTFTKIQVCGIMLGIIAVILIQ